MNAKLLVRHEVRAVQRCPIPPPVGAVRRSGHASIRASSLRITLDRRRVPTAGKRWLDDFFSAEVPISVPQRRTSTYRVDIESV